MDSNSPFYSFPWFKLFSVTNYRKIKKQAAKRLLLAYINFIQVIL